MYLMATVSGNTTVANNKTNSSSKKLSKSASSRSSSSSKCGTSSKSTSRGNSKRTMARAGAGGGVAGIIGGGAEPYDLLEMDENDNSFPWGLIHHNELATMLTAGLNKTMVIDSRSFLEYNTSTIQQSVNVCCSKLVKRRLQQDKVHILELLNQTCNTGADASWDVIVYDQCTEDPSQLTSDNFVHVLLRKLSVAFNSVAFLKGGFLAFQASHSSLVDTKTGGAYRCGTLTSLSQPCMPVSNVGPTRILPFLYLGSQQDSINPDVAQVNGISYILNVSKTCPKPPHILEGHFHRIPVNDNYCEKLLPFFNEAFQFLDKVREANGCVLVHCLGGVSRSATLAIAYIMKHMKMSSDEAYRYVKDKRPTISPNFNFLGQLLEYEKIIRQEEQAEAAHREAMRAMRQGDEDNGQASYITEKASPVIMDLHTTSPSSPGPRSSQRNFALDFPPLSSNYSAIAKCPLPDASLPVRPTIGPSSQLSAGKDDPSRRFYMSSRFDASPFPRPMTELCQASWNKNAGDECPFPGPLSYCAKASSSISSSVASNPPPVCDKAPPPLPSPVCPITGFPSPAGVFQDCPESTCPRTGFPAPGPSGSSNSGTDVRQSHNQRPQSLLSLSTETENSESDSVSTSTYQHHHHVSMTESNTKSSSSQCSKPHPRSSQKSKHGFSFSSMFSSFRWKSRPPTLPLSSPGGLMKDTGRKPAVQLTPVSETSENCDLTSTKAESPTNVLDCSGSVEAASSLSKEHMECEEFTIEDRGSIHTRSLNKDSDCSLSNATMSMASTQINLLSPPRQSSLSDPLPYPKTSGSRATKPDPTKFTLSLSSPSSEFPVWSSPLHPHSPGGDSNNKRKSGTLVGFDSPDKLAKTEPRKHSHSVQPRSLGLFERSSTRKPIAKPTVLSLSSPTAAMARLNFASPSDPPTIDLNSMAAKQYSSHSKDEQVVTNKTHCETTAKNENSVSFKISSHKSKHKHLSSETVGCEGNRSSSYPNQLDPSQQISKWEGSPGSEFWGSQSSWSGSDRRSMSSSSRSVGSSSSSSSAMSTSLSEMSFSSTSSSSAGFRAFSEFPTTSLDKLNFTPCYVKDIVQELKNQAVSTTAPKIPPGCEDSQGCIIEDANPSSSALDSPMSISSGSSAPSLASSTISPVEATMANPFSDQAPSGMLRLDHQRPVNAQVRDEPTHQQSSREPTSMEACADPMEAVVSPGSSCEYTLASESFLPQATMSPTIPSRSSSCYSQCSTMEPLSPMSLTDSSNSSPVLSPVAVYPSSTTNSPIVSSSVHQSSFLASHSCSALPSVPAANTSKVVLRRNRSKRGLDRPNSIAFSSYPTCDLVSGESPQSPSSSYTPSSHDDASEAYMMASGKRLRPSLTPDPHHIRGRTSWGGYSEREVYRQISAAMESAMLQTQAYSASSPHNLSNTHHSSRKTRSMDDILDNTPEDNEDLIGKMNGSHRGRTRFGEHLFDQYRCGLRSGSEPYHSSSSLSSNGSHGSIHSSLEIIQLPR